MMRAGAACEEGVGKSRGAAAQGMSGVRWALRG
jgi:hypothetical protein